MSTRSSSQKFLSMTIATLTGLVMCGVFAMVLFVSGALAA